MFLERKSKTSSVQQKELRSDFRTVPGDLTLAEAAEILMKEIIAAVNR